MIHNKPLKKSANFAPTIQLAWKSQFDVLDSSTIENRFGSFNAPPAFGLYFNCVSRGAGLYNIPGHDSAYIRRALGPIPIAGFFTGFEISSLAEQTSLLQYSGVLALISGKQSQR